jgi:hypothetical protein
VLTSWAHRENLVRAMLNGKKEGVPDDSIRWSWWPLALLLLAAALGFWWLQWQAAPSPEAASGGFATAETAKYVNGDDD